LGGGYGLSGSADQTVCEIQKISDSDPKSNFGGTDCLGVPGKSYVCSKNGSPKSNLRVMVGLGVPIDPYVAQTQSWGAEKQLGVYDSLRSANRIVCP